MNFLLSQLTNKDSPFAVADTPVSIVLITPTCPVIGMISVGNRHTRSVESTSLFRQAVLDIGEEWARKDKPSGWGLETLDFWSAMIEDAGGEGQPLEAYYK
jgi:hypothetical protein